MEFMTEQFATFLIGIITGLAVGAALFIRPRRRLPLEIDRKVPAPWD